MFNNDSLLTTAGEINIAYVASSARARAVSASDTGTPHVREIKLWEERLLGMARMMRTRWRRDRGIPDPDSGDMRQRFAASALIAHCEAIAASGHLTQPAEQSLRLLIAEALAAFGMLSQADRIAA